MYGDATVFPADRKRVLHVVRSLRADTGGLAEAVRTLSAALGRMGHVSRVVSLDPTDSGSPGVLTLGERMHGYGHSPLLVPWLRKHRGEYHAVIAHGLWQYQSFAVWRALAGTDTPYLVFCHGMLDPWFKRTYPLKHLKKALYWPWAEYRVLRDAAAVGFTCEAERRLARGSFRRYQAKERVLPVGVAEPPPEAEAQRAAFAEAWPELAGRRTLLFLARLHRKKGVEELLEARAAEWGRGKDAPVLVIAGPCADDAYAARLRARVRELGLAQADYAADDGVREAGAAVVWLPMLSGELKWGALQSCEAFVLLSHQENFGIAVVEALACGRPVLISDQVNIWEEIVADGAGLAAPDTVAGGRSLLARWAALPEAARAAMSTAARLSYQRRFSDEAAAAALVAAVTEVAGGA